MSFYGDTLGQITSGWTIDTSALWYWIGLIGEWIIYAGVIYIAWQIFKYKIRVEVRILRANGQEEVTFDRGKEIRKNGIPKLVLLMNRVILDMPSYDYIEKVTGRLTKMRIVYIKEGKDTYTVCKPNEVRRDGRATYTPAEQHKEFLLFLNKEIEERYDVRKKWEALAPMMLQIGFILVLIVGLYFLLGSIKDVANIASSANS